MDEPTQLPTQVRDKYSPQDWFTVMNGPGRAGLYVIAASPSGLTGVFAEAGAIARTLQEMMAGQPETPLMQAMTEAFQGAQPAEYANQQSRERARNLEDVKAQAYQGVRQAAWLVGAQMGPEDVAAYKSLLLRVAERVAEAASEGGFLGIGGVQVSDAEKEAIGELRELLGQGEAPLHRL